MKFLASPRFWLLAALCLLPVMVSNDSLWLDEGDTAGYAWQQNFSCWCQRLWSDRQADCQMPLGMLSAWVSGVILGTEAEWQLRASNVLWGALAVAGIYRVGRRLQLPWLPALLALQPYFWFYTNEARPYALQLACGSWLLVALVEFIFDRAAGTTWAWQLAVAGFLLFGATMLAPLSVGATVLAGGWIAWRQGWRPERKAILILLGGFVACLPVAAYYVATLMHGTRGAQVWRVDLKFVAYVFYELTGMGGIGLSYADIRELARSPQLAHELAARLSQLVLPALLALLLATMFFLGFRRRSPAGQPPVRLGILLAFAVTAGVFVAGSLVLQKAFWARHYAAVFPFYVTLLGLAMAGSWSPARPRWRLLPVAVCVLFAWSAFNFRFAPSLRKEDYRSAAQFARQALAEGRTVWWLASGYPASYYGLDIAYFEPEPGKVFVAFRSRPDVRTLPLPDVIVLNKPDLHDPLGVVQKIIAENHYGVAARYQAFTVWTNLVVKLEN